MARSGSSSSPISLTLPPFSGATRQLVLANVAVFIVLGLFEIFFRRGAFLLLMELALSPAMVTHGAVWQLVTYGFLDGGVLATAFAMLNLWFFGSMLEGVRGSRWLYEIYFTSLIFAGVLAGALFLLRPALFRPMLPGAGPYAAILGLMVAIGVFFGEQEFSIWGILRLKAKYLLAIWLLVDVGLLLAGDDRFGALLQLCGALGAYGFLRLVPRRGLAAGLQERYFGLRNDFYRNKRRRAARKFEVYMRKQDREVRFDKDGRFIDPDSERDPSDKRWMN